MEIKSINEGNGYKFIFKKRKWNEILGKLPDVKLQKKIIRIFREISYKSYYFQTPNIISPDSPLEFVLIRSTSLHKKKANSHKYREYMKRKPRNRTSISFNNLKGDVKLVIPYSKKDLNYGHIKDFMINASDEEIKDILLKVGEEIDKYRKKYLRSSSNVNNRLFLSTHGNGVPWLHFRIEGYPRYYLYKPYILITT